MRGLPAPSIVTGCSVVLRTILVLPLRRCRTPGSLSSHSTDPRPSRNSRRRAMARRYRVRVESSRPSWAWGEYSPQPSGWGNQVRPVAL